MIAEPNSNGQLWCKITIEPTTISVRWGCANWHEVLDIFKKTFPYATYRPEDKRWQLPKSVRLTVIAWAREGFGPTNVTVDASTAKASADERDASGNFDFGSFGMGGGRQKAGAGRAGSAGQSGSYYYRAYTSDDYSRQSGPPPRASAGGTDMHYEVLCVTPLAPWEVIKAAYKVLAQINHPDKGGNEQVMKKINASYDALKSIHGRG